MTAVASTSRYTAGEEIANSVTHGIGFLLAVAGLVLLLVYADFHGTAITVVSCAIYGATLILLYAASTLYHGIRSPRAKVALRALDHSAIYLLIAGTYTPFCLVSLRGPWGWSLLALIWSSALVGIALRVIATRRTTPRRPVVAVVIYVIMGWAALLVLKPLIAALAPEGMRLLVLGGLAYTGGVAFYTWRRLPYHHALWHGCVLLGSILHFFAVLLYVAAAPGQR